MHVYEKWTKPGGLLRYGIPDFKMEKHLVERRVAQMEAEGVSFHCGIHVGVDRPVEDLVARHDAVVLAGGAEKGRDLPIHGRGFDGVHFAMEFLPQQNRRVSGEPQDGTAPILAAGKHVVVIGGGDTGSDCIGTSIRQGALSVTNFEIMQRPPDMENKALTWPDWPLKLRTSSSHEEGVARDFAVLTQEFVGENGAVKKLRCVRCDARFKPIDGTEFELAGRPRAARHGLRASRARRHDQVARRRARSPRQRQGRHRELPHLDRQGVRRGRHAPRPVARRMGDPRRPPGRPRRR